MNVIVLTGRLAADPELKHTQGGTAVTTLRIAVERRFKSEDGQRDTDFFDVVAWKHTAEFATKYLTKGQRIAVQGRLETRTYEKDGQKMTRHQITADQLEGLDKPTGKKSSQPAEDQDYDPYAEEP